MKGRIGTPTHLVTIPHKHRWKKWRIAKNKKKEERYCACGQKQIRANAAYVAPAKKQKLSYREQAQQRGLKLIAEESQALELKRSILSQSRWN